MSIWRITTERKVWYEWHAESFLSSPIAVNTEHSGGGWNDMASTPPAVQSPISDAEDVGFFQSGRSVVMGGGGGVGEVPAVPAYEVVKIGQTSLHNPGGRSSWIGL